MPHGKKDKRDGQQTRCDELEQANNGLKMRINELFRQTKQYEAYTLQLQHDNQKLEKQLKEERQKRNELEKTHNKTVRGIEHNSQAEIIGTLKEDVKRLQFERDEKEKEIAELKHSITEFESRSSKDVAENRTHLGVADLSDSQRPQKLVEKICLLYDYKWTDAFEKSEEKGSERQICIYLLELFKTCWKFCKKTAETHFDLLVDTLLLKTEDDSQGDGYTSLSSKGIKLLRDLRTASARELLPNLYKKFKSSRIEVKADLQPYVEGCLEVCWYSALYEPQLYFVFEPDDQPEDFRKYTKSGNRVDFVVWPAMYLYENGPLMYKGVAQFTD